MFFKSIRFKIILWYMVLLTLILAAFSVILYLNFKETLLDDLDDLLVSKAEGVVNSVMLYRQMKDSGVVQSGADTAQDTQAFKDDLAAVARNWTEEKTKDPNLMSIFVQVLDTNGMRLIASKNVPAIDPLDKEDFDEVLGGEEDFDTVNGRSSQGKAIVLRTYTKPVTEDGKVAYIVQVASPLGLLYLALHGLRIKLFVLLPLTVFITGIVGAFLAKLTLRPVDSMIKTLRQITAENLKLKIHLPDTKDEIRRLADTFNEMIERLDSSFTSQQEFIQDISHELKTPLTILKGELEVTLKKLRSPQEYEAVLQSSLEEIDKISRIIDDLLILARFDSNQVTLEIKKVDMTKLIERVLNDMEILAEQKDIALSFSSRETIVLDGDEDQLRPLLVNLFDNAIKYTLRKGKVDVYASKDGNDAKIIVSDTGIGIPEEELSYIFDRFYQVSRSRGSNRGFGLGLSIAKSIVDAHKGTIEVESKPNQGATFIITLPLSYPA